MLGLVILNENFNYLEDHNTDIILENELISEEYLDLQMSLLQENNVFSKIKEWIISMWEKIKSIFSSTVNNMSKSNDKLDNFVKNFDQELSKCPKTKIEIYHSFKETIDEKSVKNSVPKIETFFSKINKAINDCDKLDKSEQYQYLNRIDKDLEKEIDILNQERKAQYKKMSSMLRTETKYISGSELLAIINNNKKEDLIRYLTNVKNENDKVYNALLKNVEKLENEHKDSYIYVNNLVRKAHDFINVMLNLNNDLFKGANLVVDHYVKSLRSAGLNMIAENRKDELKK